jgi:hypothetical protein
VGTLSPCPMPLIVLPRANSRFDLERRVPRTWDAIVNGGATEKAASEAGGPGQKRRAKSGLFKRSATALCFAGLLGVLRSLKTTGGPICLARFDILIVAGPHAKSLLVIVIDVAADALNEAAEADPTFA